MLNNYPYVSQSVTILLGINMAMTQLSTMVLIHRVLLIRTSSGETSEQLDFGLDMRFFNDRLAPLALTILTRIQGSSHIYQPGP